MVLRAFVVLCFAVFFSIITHAQEPTPVPTPVPEFAIEDGLYIELLKMDQQERMKSEPEPAPVPKHKPAPNEEAGLFLQ